MFILNFKLNCCFLQTANILRVAAINSVGTFVLFLGKIIVVIGTVFCGMRLMQVIAKEAIMPPPPPQVACSKPTNQEADKNSILIYI